MLSPCFLCFHKSIIAVTLVNLDHDLNLLKSNSCEISGTFSSIGNEHLVRELAVTSSLEGTSEVDWFSFVRGCNPGLIVWEIHEETKAHKPIQGVLRAR